MKAGTVIRVFMAKDGREVTLRAPKWDDLDDMLEFINSLVDEGADIMMDTRQTREQEVDWLARLLTRLEKDEITDVVAEVDGRFVGQVEVTKQSMRSKHVGVLGIALKDGYREVGAWPKVIKKGGVYIDGVLMSKALSE